ncbi:MAG TPA: hypothetical protein VKA70_17265 [Blastocatellia bacterium]|nr:hypothetical protein [Blastocatellia bacterium]
MYCPVCGAETIQGLKYCKQCGANLSPRGAGANIGKITGMFWAVAVFAIGALALLIGGAIGVTALGHGGSDLAAVTAIGFLVVLVISALLIWQLARVISMTQKGDRAESYPNTNVIKERRTAPQIDAPPVAAPSVTEHTTREFEPSLKREQRARE